MNKFEKKKEIKEERTYAKKKILGTIGRTD